MMKVDFSYMSIQSRRGLAPEVREIAELPGVFLIESTT